VNVNQFEVSLQNLHWEIRKFSLNKLKPGERISNKVFVTQSVMPWLAWDDDLRPIFGSWNRSDSLEILVI
jgi:hypothetical protein